ncbi:MAG: signal recognition particle-docking protein FtsY [Candidatus Micrarchaeota archaeon]
MFDKLKKKLSSFFKKEEEALDKKLDEAGPAEEKRAFSEEELVKKELIEKGFEEAEKEPSVEKEIEATKETTETEETSSEIEPTESEKSAVEEAPSEKTSEEAEEPSAEEEKPKENKERFLEEEYKRPEDQPKQKRSFIPKLTFGTRLKKAITRRAVIKGEDIESLLFDFHLELLEADVSVSVADRICADIKQVLVGKEISSHESVHDAVNNAIKKSVEDVLIESDYDIIDKIRQKKPFVILFVGPNGHGKSTTIGKFSYYLKQQGLSSVIAASDTFRAAAIEQIEKIGLKAGTPVIKHQYGADPAAVAFDAIKHAEAKKVDAVLIDTAGRSELNKNLMEEMKKIVRVAKPDLKIYIGEALAGNAAVEEARKFNEFISLDGVIMTKTDCDVKGGSILSIAYEIKKPILFMGLGQGLADLKLFKKQWFLDKIFEE